MRLHLISSFEASATIFVFPLQPRQQILQVSGRDFGD